MTKQDKEFVQSPGHLDLSDGPLKLRGHHSPIDHIQLEVMARNQFLMTPRIPMRKAAKITGRKRTQKLIVKSECLPMNLPKL